MALPIDEWFISLWKPIKVPLFNKAAWAFFTQGVFIRKSERSLNDRNGKLDESKLDKCIERWESPLQWFYLLLDSMNYLLFSLRQLLWRPFFWLYERASWENGTGILCGLGALVTGFLAFIFSLIAASIELTLMLAVLLFSPLDWVNNKLLMLGYTVTLASIGVALMGIAISAMWWVALGAAPLMMVIKMVRTRSNSKVVSDFSRLLREKEPTLEPGEIKNAIKALKIIGEKFPQTVQTYEGYINELQGYVNQVEHVDVNGFDDQKKQEIKAILVKIEEEGIPRLKEQVEKQKWSSSPYFYAAIIIILGLVLLAWVITSVFCPPWFLTLPLLFVGVKAFSTTLLVFTASTFLVMGGSATIMDQIILDDIAIVARQRPGLMSADIYSTIDDNDSGDDSTVNMRGQKIKGGKQETVYAEGILQESVYSRDEDEKKLSPPKQGKKLVLPQNTTAPPKIATQVTPTSLPRRQVATPLLPTDRSSSLGMPTTAPPTGPGSPTHFKSSSTQESRHEQVVEQSLEADGPGVGDAISTAPPS